MGRVFTTLRVLPPKDTVSLHPHTVCLSVSGTGKECCRETDRVPHPGAPLALGDSGTVERRGRFVQVPHDRGKSNGIQMTVLTWEA